MHTEIDAFICIDNNTGRFTKRANVSEDEVKAK